LSNNFIKPSIRILKIFIHLWAYLYALFLFVFIS